MLIAPSSAFLKELVGNRRALVDKFSTLILFTHGVHRVSFLLLLLLCVFSVHGSRCTQPAPLAWTTGGSRDSSLHISRPGTTERRVPFDRLACNLSSQAINLGFCRFTRSPDLQGVPFCCEKSLSRIKRPQHRYRSVFLIIFNAEFRFLEGTAIDAIPFLSSALPSTNPRVAQPRPEGPPTPPTREVDWPPKPTSFEERRRPCDRA